MNGGSPISKPREATAIKAGMVFRGLVLSLIEAAKNDPVEMKARILIARENGHLTDAEANDWIALCELEAV